MDVVRLTRDLVDIESITGNEAPVGEFLLRRLAELGWHASAMPVEGTRFNVLATAAAGARPDLFFSTHLDTVPPFMASSEDNDNVYGRGSCDAKGIIAAEIAAAERLRAGGASVGLLFLAGEERDSIGAKMANTQSPKPRFLINGEPTDSRMALAGKGAMRADVVCTGRMAHSAYPHLGESAIDKLVRVLHRIQELKLPADPEIGETTINIGIIEGGRAPNVVPDHATAQLFIRTVGPTEELKRDLLAAAGDLAELRFPHESPAIRLRTIPGMPTMVAAFGTDIPSLTNWGEPLLLGPGSIHVAHTEREFIAKKELNDAVGLYERVAAELLKS
jgi:acetylornithine deacetylase